MTKTTEEESIRLIKLGSPPKATNYNVTKVMKGNVSKNTAPEVQLRKGLFKTGARGYRIHYSKLPGSPDICFPTQKLAIFVHGCFWHRCPSCNLETPKSNTQYWENKFRNNIQRDHRNVEKLNAMGWKVLIIWECQLKVNMMSIIRQVRRLIKGES